MTEVDWSPLESTGLNSPIGVHMDIDHWKILPEWTPAIWCELVDYPALLN